MALHSRSFKDLFNSTSLFYNLDELCDTIVVGEDGVEFKTHKLFLSKGSGYFNAFFKGNFGDMNDTVHLMFNSDVLEKILIFVYIGEVHLADEDIVEIIKAADFLIIDTLLMRCRDFVLRKISLDSCIPLLTLSHEVEILQIKEHCFRFVLHNFGRLVQKYNSDIGKLPLKVFKDLISSNSLGASDEDTVWKAIVMWVEVDPMRLKNVPELILCIRWSEVSYWLTSCIAVHPIFIDNELCSGIHLEKLVGMKDGIRESESNTGRYPNKLHIMTCKKSMHQLSNPHTTMELFLTYDDQLVDIWRKIAEVEYNFDHLIALGQFLFLFNTDLNTMRAFNLMTKRWQQKTSIDTTRRNYSIVTCRNRIFAVGGYFGSDVQYYNPDTDVWSHCASLPQMDVCKTTVLSDRLYVIGYNEDFNAALNLEALTYDADQDAWSNIAKPKQFTAAFALVNFRGHIYILGGSDDTSNPIRRVEVYCPERNEWDIFPDLPFLYEFPQAAILKDKLIIYDDCHMFVPIFPPCTWNEETEAWDVEDASSLYKNLLHYRFCNVDDGRTLRELAKENRDTKTVWVKTPFE